MRPPLTSPALHAAITSRSLYRIEAFREYGTLYVSNSGATAFAKCETAATLAALGYRSRTDSIKMRIGADAHEAIATYRKGGTVADAMGVFETAYRAWSGPALDTIDDAGKAENMRRLYGWENASRVLAVYFEQWAPRYAFRFDPALVEVPFAVVFDTRCAACGVEAADHEAVVPACREGYRPRIVVTGKIDAVVFDETNDAYVDDIKTTGRLDEDFGKAFRLDSQFSHYLWAVPRAGLGIDHVEGGVVTGLEWSRMPTMRLTAKGVAEKCRTHHVPTDECHDLHCKVVTIGPLARSEHAMAAWERSVRRVAERMIEVYSAVASVEDVARVCEMDGMFKRECGWCPAREWCEGERVGAYVDATLKWEPWTGGSET